MKAHLVTRELKNKLKSLRNSCMEGYAGTWDCSTDEGREGFLAMSDSIEEIALSLGIPLNEYKNHTKE